MMEGIPVEGGTRVRFASGGDIAVSFDAIASNAGPGHHQQSGEIGQASILYGFIRHMVASLQLDTDGEIIAIAPALELGEPGVPGAPMEGNILDNLSIPTNKYMRRNT